MELKNKRFRNKESFLGSLFSKKADLAIWQYEIASPNTQLQ